MKCTASLEELSAYADGELDGVRAAAVEKHLCECESCRAQLTALQEVSGLLGESIGVADPGPRLRADFARRLAMVEDAPRFSCSRMQLAMSQMLDGELSGEDAHALHSHLETCSACAAEYASLEKVAVNVRALPEVEPPLGMERAIRAAIAREQQSFIPWQVLGRIFQPRLAPGMATAFAAATLAVGFWLGRSYPVSSGLQARAPKPVRTYVATQQPIVKAVAPAPVRARVEPRPSFDLAILTGLRHHYTAPRVAAAEPAVALAPSPKPSKMIRRKPAPPIHTLVRAPAAVASSATPDVKPLPDTGAAPAAVATGTPAPAPTAPPAPATTVADASGPQPARINIQSVGEVAAPSDVRSERRDRWWAKAKEDYDRASASLRGQPSTKAVKGTIAKLTF